MFGQNVLVSFSKAYLKSLGVETESLRMEVLYRVPETLTREQGKSQRRLLPPPVSLQREE